MLRYVKHSSKDELLEKILHLGFTSSDARVFIARGADHVCADVYSELSEPAVSCLSREGVNFLHGNNTLIVAFNDVVKVDGLISGPVPLEVSVLLEKLKDTIAHIWFRHPHINARGRTVGLGSAPPLIMGVLNVTPDSFSDGGRYFEKEKAIDRAREMIHEGADIVDIGGESTRPGSDPVGVDEELKRVIPVIEGVASLNDVLISIDTYKADVAREAFKAGAHMVNDVSGLRFSPHMGSVIAEYGGAAILMHMRGIPRDMQADPGYESLTDEILGYLRGSVELAREAGIKGKSIMIDPGIGFGKRYEDNLYILKNLEEFRSAGYPVVVGPSRKAFIGKATGKDSGDRVYGTAAAVSIAVYNGADIIRVHDVHAMRDAVLMAWEMKRGRVC